MTLTIAGAHELIGDSQSVESLFGGNEVAIDALLTPDFMWEYSDFNSFEEFTKASPWRLDSNEEFSEIDADEFDEYVDSHTVFDSWDVLLLVATREYLLRNG